ncbi:alpha/beta hydrolase fold domain-containing protein [Rhodococcus sp. (in: high G+C Gram-positive bacteria)]|uniref:flavin-containing monooxygenase n=1 Tax=Rhodococcus sp. TaxID=1831 RepID=UPI00257C67C5|nr:alpha/beta hydrolase fold domain-containing protein [Rhodococcus sp. (in: high G+C Gram-positive bacteria)]MBQ7805728.1 alpha/beta hydrolase fold domain-containing protein [Rhodococcus sp. (in: high G+C Gram-positive bacteria)]
MNTSQDVVVVGAGFAGLYAIHRFRDQLKLSVQAFEAGTGVGGTWFWNRYPGARVDVPSAHYSYSFSPEIQREWQWTEKYAAQPELLSYLEFVADKLDLKRSIAFGTRVVGAHWDEQSERWSVHTDDGAVTTARFLITAPGNLSAESGFEIAGAEQFDGQIHHTSAWPHEVDLRGKRVGVIGTGSTGIQVIQEVGKIADTLTVFQRTPNYITPLRNERHAPDRRAWLADNHEQVRAGMRENFWGWTMPTPEPSGELVSPEQRRTKFEEAYEAGGQQMTATYGDLLTSERTNAAAAEFLREKIRDRVSDPRKAEILTPTDYPFMSKRPPMETDYYDIFNRDNVDVVDVRATPITRLNRTGLVLEDGSEHELDVLIMATGFDAVTGPLLRLGIVGRGGLTLQDAWADGPRSLLGIGTPEFPNLFTITGPTSHVALQNNVLSIEDHVDFAADLVEHVLETGVSTIEPSEEGAQRWRTIVDGLLSATVIPSGRSWWMGDNVKGKKRSTFIYVGGGHLFRTILADVSAHDFGGFAVDGVASPPSPMLLVDPSVAMMVNGMLTLGVKSFLECESVTEMRELVDGFPMFQVPGPDVDVVQTRYAGPTNDLDARIYVPPKDGRTDRPVLLYFHGGGFVAGGLDSNDNVCRTLAHRLGAVVIAPSYRLAPEHPFPAPVDDALAALSWAPGIAREHGGDPQQLFLGGESSGGTLAAVLAQHARDHDGPEVAGQILISPAIEPEQETESMRMFSHVPGLPGVVVDRMWEAYLGAQPHSDSPLVSPIRAQTLSALAPALVVTFEVDPLRDEGERYAEELRRAGVDARTVRIDGLVHGAPLGLSAFLPRHQEIFEAVDGFVRDVLRSRQSTPVA